MNTYNIEATNSEKDHIILLLFTDFELIFDKDGTDREKYTYFFGRDQQYSIAKSLIYEDDFINKHFNRLFYVDDFVFCFQIKCNENDLKNRIEKGFEDFRYNNFVDVAYKDGSKYADLKYDVTLLRSDTIETVH